jgi:hypothetical protein
MDMLRTNGHKPASLPAGNAVAVSSRLSTLRSSPIIVIWIVSVMPILSGMAYCDKTTSACVMNHPGDNTKMTGDTQLTEIESDC